MAQGFKPAKAGASSKAAAKGKQKAGPRRGPKEIAPKKKAAVDLAKQKRKQTASLTRKIETEMAGRAAGGGPLTIMKSMGDEANAAREKEREKKLAKQKAKGRA